MFSDPDLAESEVVEAGEGDRAGVREAAARDVEHAERGEAQRGGGQLLEADGEAEVQ